MIVLSFICFRRCHDFSENKGSDFSDRLYAESMTLSGESK